MNLSYLLVILVGAFLAWTFWRARPEVPPAGLHAALKAGTAVLVDVREPAEWAGGTARDATLLPLSDLRGNRRHWRAFLEQNRDRELLVYCQSGARSALAAGLLRGEGFKARNAGSLSGLTRAGWPLGPARS